MGRETKMAVLELSSSKNILKIHCYTTTENLISDIFCWWHALMVYSRPIGMRRGIFEHLHPVSAWEEDQIYLFIWLMTPFRKIARIMGDLRRGIRLAITRWTIIWRKSGEKRRASLFLREYFREWRKLLLMQSRQRTCLWTKLERRIIFNFLGWISWSITICNLGSSRSTLILALKRVALCWTSSFPNYLIKP